MTSVTAAGTTAGVAESVVEARSAETTRAGSAGEGDGGGSLVSVTIKDVSGKKKSELLLFWFHKLRFRPGLG